MNFDSFDVVEESTPVEETGIMPPVPLADGFHKREIRRLRNSVSFRLGVLFTEAVTRPWMLLLLPFTVFYLIYCAGMERLGKRPAPHRSRGQGGEQLSRKDCIVLFPTNGVGFGHFTRMYALAKRWKKHSPATEIVFFTTMPTLHLLYNEGFPTYHLAGRKKYKDVTASQWNTMVEEQLSLIFAQHKPSSFIFDGAYPYRGMLNAIRSHQGMEKVWLRRGTFKKGSDIPVDSIEHFDLLVRPEDSIPMKTSEIEHNVKTITVPPIVLLDDEDLMSKEDARKRLGLPLGNKVVYVQLGAGRINDINSEISLTLKALLSHPNITVVLGESMLGERLSIDFDDVILLRDYPNSMYFKTFDATIQAGGYNSYHEVRKFGLPTVFYPNMQTGMDDQLARCKQSEEEGWGLVIEKRTKQEINRAVEELVTMKRKTVHSEVNGAYVLYTELKK
jgi:hypothetical protein